MLEGLLEKMSCEGIFVGLSEVEKKGMFVGRLERVLEDGGKPGGLPEMKSGGGGSELLKTEDMGSISSRRSGGELVEIENDKVSLSIGISGRPKEDDGVGWLTGERGVKGLMKSFGSVTGRGISGTGLGGRLGIVGLLEKGIGVGSLKAGVRGRLPATGVGISLLGTGTRLEPRGIVRFSFGGAMMKNRVPPRSLRRISGIWTPWSDEGTDLSPV